MVVSDSLRQQVPAGWGDSEQVRRAEAHDAVRRLKAQDGADILVFGNGVLGDGVPAFTRRLLERLRLRETRPLEGSDNGLFVYAPR